MRNIKRKIVTKSIILILLISFISSVFLSSIVVSTNLQSSNKLVLKDNIIEENIHFHKLSSNVKKIIHGNSFTIPIPYGYDISVLKEKPQGLNNLIDFEEIMAVWQNHLNIF